MNNIVFSHHPHMLGPLRLPTLQHVWSEHSVFLLLVYVDKH